MSSTLLSYAEAAEQVQRFIAAMAEGRAIPLDPSADGLPADDQSGTEAGPASRPHAVALGAAAGRVLAAAIRADRDLPPFPRSTRDGFACRSAEASTHQFLFVAGRIRAGMAPETIGAGSLAPGEAWEIMTGAPVPPGADAVFMVEHAEHSGGQPGFSASSADSDPEPVADFVRLQAPRTLEPGDNIVPQGAEARESDVLVPPGVRIGPAQIALAAQCGYIHLEVEPRPRVAILSTGDELVPVESIPGPSQIRNSNSPMLAAQVAAAGGEPLVLAAVPDQEALLDREIGRAIRQAMHTDLLLITGGISAGRFDLVEDALTRAGARFFFGGVAIQPGKPVVFGQLPRAAGRPLPFFALPGNPISSAVTFQLFAAPLLSALGGDAGTHPRFVLAQLTGEWRGKPGLTRFLPGWCDFGSETGPETGRTAEVRLVPWQGSGDLAAFARSNCLTMIPSDVERLEAGSLVQILIL